jgi:metacaspase-1
MAKGMALTIGLNSVDPKHYGGWSGDLNACEADARDMAEIVKSMKFKISTLLTKSATRKNVASKISGAAKALKAGDIFMLSYSGHGGQLPDINSDETDAEDETWCLYDGELIDDELYDLFSRFKLGVRILVFSDSCHSGTVVKMAYYQGAGNARASVSGSAGTRYRNMPPDVALRAYRNNKAFYDKILRNPKIREAPEKVKASVLLISGCQDNQLSSDGDFNGLFTAQLLKVWRNGTFKGAYRKFHKDIVKRMPPDQTPNYFRAGKTNTAFEAQKPFAI